MNIHTKVLNKILADSKNILKRSHTMNQVEFIPGMEGLLKAIYRFNAISI